VDALAHVFAAAVSAGHSTPAHNLLKTIVISRKQLGSLTMAKATSVGLHKDLSASEEACVLLYNICVCVTAFKVEKCEMNGLARLETTFPAAAMNYRTSVEFRFYIERHTRL
jgi:hypothetical protein